MITSSKRDALLYIAFGVITVMLCSLANAAPLSITTTVTINAKPTINATANTVFEDGSVTLTVIPTGTEMAGGGYDYQWYDNGGNPVGLNQDTYSPDTSTAGIYNITCEVVNAVGPIVSEVETINVIVDDVTLTVSGIQTNEGVEQGPINADDTMEANTEQEFVLTALAESATHSFNITPTYAWKYNGSDTLPDGVTAVGAVLTIGLPNTTDHAGGYSCSVTYTLAP